MRRSLQIERLPNRLRAAHMNARSMASAARTLVTGKMVLCFQGHAQTTEKRVVRFLIRQLVAKHSRRYRLHLKVREMRRHEKVTSDFGQS